MSPRNSSLLILLGLLAGGVTAGPVVLPRKAAVAPAELNLDANRLRAERVDLDRQIHRKIVECGEIQSLLGAVRRLDTAPGDAETPGEPATLLTDRTRGGDVAIDVHPVFATNLRMTVTARRGERRQWHVQIDWLSSQFVKHRIAVTVDPLPRRATFAGADGGTVYERRSFRIFTSNRVQTLLVPRRGRWQIVVVNGFEAMRIELGDRAHVAKCAATAINGPATPLSVVGVNDQLYFYEQAVSAPDGYAEAEHDWLRDLPALQRHWDGSREPWQHELLTALSRFVQLDDAPKSWDPQVEMKSLQARTAQADRLRREVLRLHVELLSTEAALLQLKAAEARVTAKQLALRQYEALGRALDRLEETLTK